MRTMEAGGGLESDEFRFAACRGGSAAKLTEGDAR